MKAVPRHILLLSVGLVFALAGTAFGSVASEQKDGARALRAFKSAGKQCASLDQADFEHIGEYVMGRGLRSLRAHEQMNSLMESMMGESAADQMHVVMGRRATGCGNAVAPGSYRNMLGMMGLMGGLGVTRGRSGGNGLGSMMGSGRRASGSMMGGSGSDGDSNGVWIAIVAALGVITALAVAALLLSRRGADREGESPLDILNRRFAQGELDQQEYERRRRAIEAPGHG
jgi:putative membrane protein